MSRLQEHFYGTIHHSGKKVSQIAEALGRAESTVYRWGLPWEGEGATGCPPPIEALVPLLLFTGNNEILDHLEASVGRVAIPLPKLGDIPDEELSAGLVRAVKEFSEVAQAVADALLDGKVTRREFQKIEKETDEQIRSVLALLEKIRQRAPQ